MYTITRKNRIKEQLQLCHADGTPALTVDVDLNVDEIAARVNKAYEVLGSAQIDLQEDPKSAKAQEAYGKAVLAMFDVIFGEANTGALIQFYENNFTEMLLDVFPFINDEIMPKIREASAARKQQLADAARKVRSGNRRGLFR